jgi:hypothetical protein
MRIRHLTTAAVLALFAALAIPLGASANGILPPSDAFGVDGTLGGSAVAVEISFTNTSSDGDLDILEITLDGTTALSYPLEWFFGGFATNPSGATSSKSGEGTTLLTLTLADVGGAGADAGFNPAETLSLSNMDADGLPPGSFFVPVEDFVGVVATVFYQSRPDKSDDTTWGDVMSADAVFVEDLANPGSLKLSVVPEPGTAALLGMGLVGLALQPRRRR